MKWHTSHPPGRRSLAGLAAVVMLIATTAACGGEPVPAAGTPQPGDHALSLTWDGKQRDYRLHAPAGYTGTEPVPVVIALHSYPSDGEALQTMIGLDRLADQHGFLTVYPNGVAGGFNAMVCCGQEDDVGFIRALVEALRTTWSADPRRIYLTGISNGGDMSFRLGVELSDTFAAIAPVSGGFIGDQAADPTYRPKSPLSVLTFIGGQDRYAGQFESGITVWQQRLGCRPGEAVPVDGPQRITHTTATCADGSEVKVYRLPGLGHSWPGATEGPLPGADAGLIATDLIWEFFSTHARRS